MQLTCSNVVTAGVQRSMMDGWMDGMETVVDMIGRGNDKDYSFPCMPSFLIPREEEGGRGRGHDQPPCRRHGCQIEFFTPSPKEETSDSRHADRSTGHR